TINTIIGFVPPRRGVVIFKGEDVTHTPSHRIANMGMALVPQGRRLFPSLTVQENITLAARGADGNGSWTVEEIHQLFPILTERAHHHANQLSGGEQQMVALARALMTNPDLLLLDEPSEGLAPLLVREIGRVLLELKKRDLSILLVEQNLPLATQIADRVYVMSKGQIVFEGTPEDLRSDKAVQTRYLGV
ncbi:MAG: ABC transporter ATP-binding protein, partial [Chloroflexota bacterium]|nr:ABC transporter ATP-binding protein [Chloroflexota bacterium]